MIPLRPTMIAVFACSSVRKEVPHCQRIFIWLSPVTAPARETRRLLNFLDTNALFRVFLWFGRNTHATT